MRTERNLVKNLAALLLISLCLSFVPVIGKAEISMEKNEAKRLEELIPPAASELFSWPSDSALTEKNILDSSSPEAKSAKKKAMFWIKKSLDSAWWPNDEAAWYCIPKMFENRDVVWVSWKHGGYEVQVAQTATIFTIKLTNIGSVGFGSNNEERFSTTRKLCMDLFAKEGKRWTDQGQEIKIPNLNQKIASYSFKRANSYSVGEEQAIWGKPEPMDEENVRKSVTGQSEDERQRDDNPANTNWDKTRKAWRYWFRTIFWWNDGHAVGYYFTKMESGSRLSMSPNEDPVIYYYDPSLDRKWFLGR